MSAMYGVYHGPHGLKAIANRIHNAAVVLKRGLEDAGHTVINEAFFDTIKVCIQRLGQKWVKDKMKIW